MAAGPPGLGWRRWWWWFTLEGKVNSSCCFKSLGKPRPPRALRRAYRNVSQRASERERAEIFRSQGAHDASSSSCCCSPVVGLPQGITFHAITSIPYLLSQLETRGLTSSKYNGDHRETPTYKTPAVGHFTNIETLFVVEVEKKKLNKIYNLCCFVWNVVCHLFIHLDPMILYYIGYNLCKMTIRNN